MVPPTPFLLSAARHALVALTFLAPACAVAKKQEKPPQPEMFAIDPSFQTKIHMVEDLRGKSSSWLVKSRIVIDKGVFSPTMGLRAGDREWLLMPYVVIEQGQAVSPNSRVNVVNDCISEFTRLLAVDRKTFAIEPWVWKIQDHHCGRDKPTRDGEWGDAVAIESGKVEITGLNSEAEAAAAERAQVAEQQHQAQQDAALETSMLPRKRQIGTRLCQTREGYQYIGYTEAVSPDNGKIKIRVADAVLAGSRSVRPGGFQEQIIWDDPARWSVCE